MSYARRDSLWRHSGDGSNRKDLDFNRVVLLNFVGCFRKKVAQGLT